MILQDSVRTVFSHPDTVNRVQNITHGKFNVFESYFYHLAKNPERIDALLMWTICTFVAWFVLFRYRKEILKGLEGHNILFEAGEVVSFISLWCFPPILFRIAFFKDSSTTQLYAMWAVLLIMMYQLTGRYIFDWALALKGGLSSVPVAEPPKQSAPTVNVNVDQSPKT